MDAVSTNVSPNPLVGSEFLSVFRSDPDGRVRKVILPSDTRLSASAWSGYDYHAPFNKAVTYQVVPGVVDSISGSGFWDYAPAPNILPSDFAAMGRLGSPTANGWKSTGTRNITAAGSNVLVSADNAAATTYYALAQVSIDPGAVSPYTLSVKFAPGLVVNAKILLMWASAGGLYPGYTETAPTPIASGPLVTLVATRPADAVGVSITFIFTGAGTISPVTITGISLQQGAGTSIPAPQYIDAPAVPATLTSKQAWLTHPVDPGLSVPVNISGQQTSTSRASRAAVFQILGSRLPVTRSDGVRNSLTGETTFLTDTLAAADALDQISSRSEPLLINFASPNPVSMDYPWMWVQPGDFTRDWVNLGQTKRRLVSFSWVEVDQPAVAAGALWTWDDVVAEYATINDVNAAYRTLANLAIDTRGI